MATLVTGAEIVTDARRYLGIPYKWGGGPSDPRAGLDCSGLVQRVAFDLGFGSCPRTSEEQFVWVDRTDGPAPGRLVFFTGASFEGDQPPGHVAFVVAPGIMIDAPTTGEVVSVQHFDPNGVGEEKVMGYGAFPKSATSASGNPSTTNPMATAEESAAAGAASIGMLILLALVIGAIVAVGFVLR